MITEKSLQDIIGYVCLGSACAVSAVFGFYILGGDKIIESIKNKYLNIKEYLKRKDYKINNGR